MLIAPARHSYDETAVGAAVPSHSEYRSSASSIPRREHDEGITMRISRGPYARKIRGESRNVLRWSNRDVAEKVASVCHATYEGDQSKAKSAAHDSGQSARAAENWFAGDNPMSLTAFLNAYHANPTFKVWARKILLMERETDPEFQAELARFITAAQRMGQGE